MTSLRRNNVDTSDPEKGNLLDDNPSSPTKNNGKTNQSESPQIVKPTSSPRTSGGATGSPIKAIAACALYSFCSVSMVLTNKSLASRYASYYQAIYRISFFTIQDKTKHIPIKI